MRLIRQRTVVASIVALTLLGACGSNIKLRSFTTFFVTSSGLGKGADLGGILGADAQCQRLADSIGAGDLLWHAYLSTQPSGGAPGTNARDRIGSGPWRNAHGRQIASNVEDLHTGNVIDKTTALTEKGERINGFGDTPNEHDILTGSQPDGRYIAGDVDSTCGNWTHSGADGAAMVGHSDRKGLDDSVPAKSWNSAHQTRGCSQEALKATGGSGRFYCFAVD